MAKFRSVLGVSVIVALLAIAGATSYGSIGAIVGLILGIGIVFGAAKVLEGLQDVDRFDPTK